MKPTLDKIIIILTDKKCPEEIFGFDSGEASSLFREYSKLCHPDKFSDALQKRNAEALFKRLNEWYQKALKKIEDGTYGDCSQIDPVTLTTKKHTYKLTREFASGEICELYEATDEAGVEVIVKICRLPKNNVLVKNEARILREIHEVGAKGLKTTKLHIPKLIDSFDILDGSLKKTVNVLPKYEGYISLAQLRAKYGPLNIRDAAWMFNRLLESIMPAHYAGIIHGAIHPQHFMVDIRGGSLTEHNGILLDWSFAVEEGKKIPARTANQSCFAPELFHDPIARFGVDLYSAAMCMFKICPEYPMIAPSIKAELNACKLGPIHRTSDVWELHKSFNKKLDALFPRQFRRFEMPEITKTT